MPRQFLVSAILLMATPAIAGPPDRRAALVIIDMQPNFTERYDGKPLSARQQETLNAVLRAQLDMIHRAKKAKLPIVFVEYSLKPYDKQIFKPTRQVLVDAATRGYKQVKRIRKGSDGMLDQINPFRKELTDYLAEQKIGTLLVTGANGGNCVRASIQGALDADLNVIAYENGIIDFNFENYIHPYTRYRLEGEGFHTDRCDGCRFQAELDPDVALSAVRGPPAPPAPVIPIPLPRGAPIAQ